MIHPVIISSNGKIEIQKKLKLHLSDLKKLKKIMDAWNLPPQKMLMSKQDYEDLIKYFGIGN